MDEFKYVSAVEGKAVARYGSGTATRSNMVIGGVQRADGYEIDPKAVVRIPLAEWTRYGKEYARALANKALKPRTKEDYDAWVKAEEKRVDDEAAKVKAEAAAKAKAEADEAAKARRSEELPAEIER